MITRWWKKKKDNSKIADSASALFLWKAENVLRAWISIFIIGKLLFPPRTAKLPLPLFLRDVDPIEWEDLWNLPCLWWSLLLRARAGLDICSIHPRWQPLLSVLLLGHGKEEMDIKCSAPLCVLEQTDLHFWLSISFHHYPWKVDMTSNIPSISDPSQN